MKTIQINLETILNKEQRKTFGFLMEQTRTNAEREQVQKQFEKLAYLRLQAMKVIK